MQGNGHGVDCNRLGHASRIPVQEVSRTRQLTGADQMVPAHEYLHSRQGRRSGRCSLDNSAPVPVLWLGCSLNASPSVTCFSFAAHMGTHLPGLRRVCRTVGVQAIRHVSKGLTHHTHRSSAACRILTWTKAEFAGLTGTKAHLLRRRRRRRRDCDMSRRLPSVCLRLHQR